MIIIENDVLREVESEDVLSSLISKMIKLERKISKLERKLTALSKKERR